MESHGRLSLSLQVPAPPLSLGFGPSLSLGFGSVMDRAGYGPGRLWTGPVMDIHQLIYNTPPWMP